MNLTELLIKLEHADNAIPYSYKGVAYNVVVLTDAEPVLNPLFTSLFISAHNLRKLLIFRDFRDINYNFDIIKYSILSQKHNIKGMYA